MLKAGFYEKNVTPPIGCHIPGFFVPRIADDVLADLYARAAVIDDGNEKVAMIALDMCGATDYIANGIIERAHEFTGIKKENILVCSTHLHTGAPTMEDTYNLLKSSNFELEKLSFPLIQPLDNTIPG